MLTFPQFIILSSVLLYHGKIFHDFPLFIKPSMRNSGLTVSSCLHLILKMPINIYFCFIDYPKAFDCMDHNKLWKILKEMGISAHLTCLLRNLHAGQEAKVRTEHGTRDWFQIGKGIHQGCILSPSLFNLYEEYIMRNTGWRKHKLESRLPGEIPITLDMLMTPSLWQKMKRN